MWPGMDHLVTPPCTLAMDEAGVWWVVGVAGHLSLGHPHPVHPPLQLCRGPAALVGVLALAGHVEWLFGWTEWLYLQPLGPYGPYVWRYQGLAVELQGHPPGHLQHLPVPALPGGQCTLAAPRYFHKKYLNFTCLTTGPSVSS